MSDEFYICICSPLGPTYQFMLRDGTVYYGFSTQHLIRSPEHLPALEHQPEPRAIEEFWSRILEIGVARWDREYRNDEISDGPNWEIAMSYEGAHYTSRGTAAFPGNPHPAYSPDFIELIIAIRRLLNWMPFG
ncbi:hypothetical protein [Spirochaeta africana]|uniref:Uncharacterized protein n=1 Tax=Spirochaeta africana (strain ATCC 700263 / DSM 8902 / Z-7692) TaxID=889378 RepID=H9UGZ9_SPIAZ|nr:hypothetical protein [Spirochaeta africana]AFG36792.1 hypothetical protein Spiaf_0692 [Spirochaeta africana DSM 8902]